MAYNSIILTCLICWLISRIVTAVILPIESSSGLSIHNCNPMDNYKCLCKQTQDSSSCEGNETTDSSSQYIECLPVQSSNESNSIISSENNNECWTYNDKNETRTSLMYHQLILDNFPQINITSVLFLGPFTALILRNSVHLIDVGISPVEYTEQLTQLKVDNVPLKHHGLFTVLKSFQRLEILIITNTHLASLPEGSISHLNSLTEINLSNNRLFVIHSRAFELAPSIRHINLANNQLGFIADNCLLVSKPNKSSAESEHYHHRLIIDLSHNEVLKFMPGAFNSLLWPSTLLNLTNVAVVGGTTNLDQSLESYFNTSSDHLVTMDTISCCGNSFKPQLLPTTDTYSTTDSTIVHVKRGFLDSIIDGANIACYENSSLKFDLASLHNGSLMTPDSCRLLGYNDDESNNDPHGSEQMCDKAQCDDLLIGSYSLTKSLSVNDNNINNNDDTSPMLDLEIGDTPILYRLPVDLITGTKSKLRKLSIHHTSLDGESLYEALITLKPLQQLEQLSVQHNHLTEVTHRAFDQCIVDMEIHQNIDKLLSNKTIKSLPTFIDLSHNRISQVRQYAFRGYFKWINLSHNRLGTISDRAFIFNTKANSDDVTIVDLSNNPSLNLKVGSLDHIDATLGVSVNLTNTSLPVLPYEVFVRYLNGSKEHKIVIDQIDCCRSRWLMDYLDQLSETIKCQHNVSVQLSDFFNTSQQGQPSESICGHLFSTTTTMDSIEWPLNAYLVVALIATKCLVAQLIYKYIIRRRLRGYDVKNLPTYQ